MTTSTPKVSPGHDKRNERRNGEGGIERKMATTSMHDDVLLDSEECYKSETGCAHAHVDSLVGCLESARSGEVAVEVPC